MEKRSILFWIFAIVQALIAYIFGLFWLYPGTTTLFISALPTYLLCLLIISSLGIEYLIYSKE
jgi:hypothetical protein